MYLLEASNSRSMAFAFHESYQTGVCVCVCVLSIVARKSKEEHVAICNGDGQDLTECPTFVSAFATVLDRASLLQLVLSWCIRFDCEGMNIDHEFIQTGIDLAMSLQERNAFKGIGHDEYF